MSIEKLKLMLALFPITLFLMCNNNPVSSNNNDNGTIIGKWVCKNWVSSYSTFLDGVKSEEGSTTYPLERTDFLVVTDKNIILYTLTDCWDTITNESIDSAYYYISYSYSLIGDSITGSSEWSGTEDYSYGRLTWKSYLSLKNNMLVYKYVENDNYTDGGISVTENETEEYQFVPYNDNVPPSSWNYSQCEIPDMNFIERLIN